MVLARQRLSIRRGMCPAEDGRDTARKVDGACGTEAKKVDWAWGMKPEMWMGRGGHEP